MRYFIMQIIIGLIVIGLGVVMTIKSEWMLNNFGSIDFFEAKLGTAGGSRLGYKLLGLAIAFIGILIFTDLIGGFLNWLLSPLMKYSQT